MPKINPDRMTQLERSRKALCARCGAAFARHRDGTCRDGGGSYTWAQTSAELDATIKALENVLDDPRLHGRRIHAP